MSNLSYLYLMSVALVLFALIRIGLNKSIVNIVSSIILMWIGAISFMLVATININNIHGFKMVFSGIVVMFFLFFLKLFLFFIDKRVGTVNDIDGEIN